MKLADLVRLVEEEAVAAAAPVSVTEISTDEQWNAAKALGKQSGVAAALAVKRHYKTAVGGEKLHNTCEKITVDATAGSIILSDEGLKKNCGTYSMDSVSFGKKYKVLTPENPAAGTWGIASKIPGGEVEYIYGLNPAVPVKSWNGMITPKESGSYAIRYGAGDYAYIDPAMFADSYTIKS